MAAPAAVVEPIASPAPAVEVPSAPVEPIAAATSGPIAAAPETIAEPIQQPAPTVETLSVAEVVPAEVASEGPGVSSPVAAATSLGKTAVVAAAPVVSAPVAVVEAPGAAVNTPIVTPVPVMAAPAAVVEPIASPAPAVEVPSAASEPMAAATQAAVDLPTPTADPVFKTPPVAEVPVDRSPLPATASTAGIGSPHTEFPVVTSTVPAISIPEKIEDAGVPFEAITATAPSAGLEVFALSASPVIAPGPSIPVTPAVAEQPIEAVIYRKFRLQEVTFGTNQWKISQEGIAALAMVAEQLRKENKEFLLRVDGHTDSLGSDNYNDKLSLQRSITIATNMVVHNGFDPARLFVKGFGESKPLASNDSAEGKAKNRRVEILVLLPKKVPSQ
jgi:outer membrane protein OmpA-like peptidoglycan-associated protein